MYIVRLINNGTLTLNIIVMMFLLLFNFKIMMTLITEKMKY